MDDAARLTCPFCGHERIIWVAEGQQQAACPECGARVTVERIEDVEVEGVARQETVEEEAARQDAATEGLSLEGAALDVFPDAEEEVPVHLPGTLDVELPPESEEPEAPTYPSLAPLPMMPNYEPPQVSGHWPQPRNVLRVVVSLGMVIIGLIAVGVVLELWLSALNDPEDASAAKALTGGLMLVLLCHALLTALYFVLLLIWVYQVHLDVEALSLGAHSPTPGLAMGLLFVPVVHGFWLWHVLRCLSERVSSNEEDGRGAVGAIPLIVFLAIQILMLVAMPFLIAFASHVQSSGVVPEAFLLFIGGLLALQIMACACLALALSSIGHATAAYTATMLPQWTPEAPPAAPSHGQPQ